jgi:Acetoacetate decarboxylase (ADC)
VATDAGRFPDPWPSVQPSWPAAPWRMSGTVVTAWFDLPHDALTSLISPSLVPDADDVRPSRLRFYDVDFHSDDLDATQSRDGHFREAVIGVPAAYEGQTGEVSALMWSDSDTYMHWGRDVFGWPILRAPVTLDGALWAGDLAPRTSAYARVDLPDGSHASITIHAVGGELPPPAPAAWFTPRLVPEPASVSERRELLVVRPEQIDSGRRHELSGSVELMFREPHPLAGITVGGERIETSVGFVIRVGDRVELL